MLTLDQQQQQFIIMLGPLSSQPPTLRRNPARLAGAAAAMLSVVFIGDVAPVSSSAAMLCAGDPIASFAADRVCPLRKSHV